MKLLLDTNVMIAADPTPSGRLEDNIRAAVDVVALAQHQKHQLYVHPATLLEISKDRDDRRREARSILAGKYLVLPAPPGVSDPTRTRLGLKENREHDAVDAALLEAILVDAADYLVTEDRRLLGWAKKMDVGERVITPEALIIALRRLFPTMEVLPPAVERVYSHELNRSDPIFGGLREDYPGFDDWLSKCSREHRFALIVRGDHDDYAALAIIKAESDPQHGMPGQVSKLCTFKVSPAYWWRGLGELLLNAVFHVLYELGSDWTFVTVLPKHRGLVLLLEDFGFEMIDGGTPLGEGVWAKPMSTPDEPMPGLSPLEFNRRFGPRAILEAGARPVVIPIVPKYHRLLFPDAETQASMFPGDRASGNAIKKAYLCHAQVKNLQPGTVALFYRSRDRSAIQCVGVVEKSERSQDPLRIARLVGTRTVYSMADIEVLCNREVLAVLFRYARRLREPIPIGELMRWKVLAGAPQSITTVQEEGMGWIYNEIDVRS